MESKNTTELNNKNFFKVRRNKFIKSLKVYLYLIKLSANKNKEGGFVEVETIPELKE